jgi:hypothetical protein
MVTSDKRKEHEMTHKEIATKAWNVARRDDTYYYNTIITLNNGDERRVVGNGHFFAVFPPALIIGAPDGHWCDGLPAQMPPVLCQDVLNRNPKWGRSWSPLTVGGEQIIIDSKPQTVILKSTDGAQATLRLAYWRLARDMGFWELDGKDEMSLMRADYEDGDKPSIVIMPCRPFARITVG